MTKILKGKTNALRYLDAKKIRYAVHEYKAKNGFLDGISVAKVIGIDKKLVYKTLVTQGNSKEYYVCVIPVAEELDLKKVAKHFGEKKIEMILAREITKVTGYIKGGCSPIGMKKQFRTAIDMNALDLDQIVISAGKVGLQVELSVSELVIVVGAELDDLIVD